MERASSVWNQAGIKWDFWKYKCILISKNRIAKRPCSQTTHLQCSYWGKEVVGQNLAIHGPIHPPLNTVQSSCPLSREAPWCFHPHASRLGWWSRDCTHPSSSSKHEEWSLYQKVLFWSHLTTWPSPMPPLDHPDGLWQTSDGPGHVLAWAGGPFLGILIHDGVVC